jgi:hypothetical protein
MDSNGDKKSEMSIDQALREEDEELIDIQAGAKEETYQK